MERNALRSPARLEWPPSPSAPVAAEPRAGTRSQSCAAPWGNPPKRGQPAAAVRAHPVSRLLSTDPTSRLSRRPPPSVCRMQCEGEYRPNLRLHGGRVPGRRGRPPPLLRRSARARDRRSPSRALAQCARGPSRRRARRRGRWRAHRSTRPPQRGSRSSASGSRRRRS